MKRVLMLAAVLLILMASPVMALTQGEAQQIAFDEGCNVEVQFLKWGHMDDWNAVYGSVYGPFAPPVIALINMHEFPDAWQRFILYHEIGHCMGARGEWDADKYAIRAIAKDGLDGADVMHSIWAWEARDGDFSRVGTVHGAYTHRITRGYLNRWVTKVESP